MNIESTELALLGAMWAVIAQLVTTPLKKMLAMERMAEPEQWVASGAVAFLASLFLPDMPVWASGAIGLFAFLAVKVWIVWNIEARYRS